MSAIAAIGEPERVRVFALAGVNVAAARDATAARAAWLALPADTSLVILTPMADTALAQERHSREGPLCAVMGP